MQILSLDLLRVIVIDATLALIWQAGRRCR
jgi:hypothetical protein